MIETVMRHIRNYFPTGMSYEGKVTITDGAIDLPIVEDGNYYLIEGSVFNNGVWLHPADGLKDETFDGRITLLAPPRLFVDTVGEIELYVAENKTSPYVSESFANYSYTKATDASGNIIGWQGAFKSRLDEWRKV